MKKIHLILLCCGLAVLNSCKEVLTEEQYIIEDDKIWKEYDNKMDEIYKYQSKHPEKRDSLNSVKKHISDQADIKNMETAIKYARTQNGLARLFILRTDMPKEKLQSIYNKLPTKVKESKNGKTLSLYLEANQIKVGDKILDFKSFDTNGNEFELSKIKNKKILLLYGGLKCIREFGRKELLKLYQKTGKDNLEIVVYQPSDNLSQLKKSWPKYQSNFTLISDFKGQRSPIKVIYAAQTLPTVFLFDKKGILKIKRDGFSDEFMKYVTDLD